MGLASKFLWATRGVTVNLKKLVNRSEDADGCPCPKTFIENWLTDSDPTSEEQRKKVQESQEITMEQFGQVVSDHYLLSYMEEEAYWGWHDLLQLAQRQPDAPVNYLTSAFPYELERVEDHRIRIVFDEESQNLWFVEKDTSTNKIYLAILREPFVDTKPFYRLDPSGDGSSTPDLEAILHHANLPDAQRTGYFETFVMGPRGTLNGKRTPNDEQIGKLKKMSMEYFAKNYHKILE